MIDFGCCSPHQFACYQTLLHWFLPVVSKCDEKIILAIVLESEIGSLELFPHTINMVNKLTQAWCFRVDGSVVNNSNNRLH